MPGVLQLLDLTLGQAGGGLRAGQIFGGTLTALGVRHDFFLKPGDVFNLGHERLQILADHFGVGFRAENADEKGSGARAFAFGKIIPRKPLQLHSGVGRNVIERGTPAKNVLRLFSWVEAISVLILVDMLWVSLLCRKQPPRPIRDRARRNDPGLRPGCA